MPTVNATVDRPTRGGRGPMHFFRSVRVRILTAVLITTAIGMIGAGLVSYTLARNATDESVRNGLLQENEEIKTVARIAEQGYAGRPIRGPSDLLYVAIKSSVPDPDQAIIGLINGQVAWVPDASYAFQETLPTDLELIRAAATVPSEDPVVVHRLATDQHDPVAFISVPIRIEGSSDLGHYVAAVDVRSALEPVQQAHRTYALVCLLALAVVGVVGYQVAGRLLSPLRSLRRTAQRITDTDLSDRIPAQQLSSNDEVADLGRVMNAMLDRISSSFDHQRQMLDDAGHELRTPITILRGHLELVEPTDAADVTRTRELALDELDRMHRLVEELLVLAKARRPDFLRPEPVEVSFLLSSVLDKMTPLAQRRWTLDASSDATIVVDPQRITQALLQLVANAIRFSGSGSTIALGGRVESDRAVLWVRDEGIGIDITDQQRIFERFGRGGRRPPEQPLPGQAGLGLGLPIVHAIAEAHRGRVSLASTPDRGSTFSLILPRGAFPEVGRRTDREVPWPRS